MLASECLEVKRMIRNGVRHRRRHCVVGGLQTCRGWCGIVSVVCFYFPKERRGEKRANMGGLGKTMFRTRFVRIIRIYIVVEGRMYVSLPFPPTPLLSFKSCADVHLSQTRDIPF